MHTTSGPFSGVAEVKVILDGRRARLNGLPKVTRCWMWRWMPGWTCPMPAKVLCAAPARRVLWKGKVEMEMNYALTDEEVADGYVLTCQTHPRSARVVRSTTISTRTSETVSR
jgi:ring-1,2-phenylacetyl-CoA epoxidase subunit PaaE